MSLSEYFKQWYEQFQGNWKAESALALLGEGKSNEGTEESKAIKRYYIVPVEKRFQQIFLNFDKNRNVDSIVWFFGESETLTIGKLKELFGSFKIFNIIYDDTTEVIFYPTDNIFIQYVKTSILEWVYKRNDGTLYFKKGNEEFDISDDYEVSSLMFKANDSA